MCLLFNIIDSESLYNNIYGLLMPLILMSALIYSYNSLTTLLNQFHNEHYQSLKKTMRYYYVFEVIGVSADGIYCLFALA